MDDHRVASPVSSEEVLEAGSRKEKTIAFIIGAAKCATTSLWFYLSNHPEIFAHPLKETKFFYKKDEGIEGDRLRKEFITIFEDTRDPKLEKAKVLLEATPGNFFNPRAAERMARACPDAKLLLIVRDPVRRAYSEWQMRHRKDNPDSVTLEMFAEDVDRDIARLEKSRKKGLARKTQTNDNRNASSSSTSITTSPSSSEGVGDEMRDENEEFGEIDWDEYFGSVDIDDPKGRSSLQPIVARGMYYDQLQTWLKYYKPEQLCVLHTNDMRGDTARRELKRVARFLGIDQDFVYTDEVLNAQMNTGGNGFSLTTMATAHNSPIASKPMPEDVRKRLYEFFEPHNNRLFHYLGRTDLKWVYTPPTEPASSTTTSSS
jgi:hypothetical protein